MFATSVLRPGSVRGGLLVALLVSGAWTQEAEESAPAVAVFNSASAQLVTDAVERDRLITNTPQWALQLLTWPSSAELERHLGVRVQEQVDAATELAQAIFQERWVPPNLDALWIPLRNWNIFYTDWVNHGGADAFLMNCAFEEVRLQVADTPNFVIVGVRPRRPCPSNVPLQDWVLETARDLFTPAVLPAEGEAPDRFRVIKTWIEGEIIEGDWLPRGPGDRRAPSSVSGDIERVKFFTTGRVAVYSIPKFLWDPASLVNPFAERFPAPSSPAEIAEVTQMLFRPQGPTPTPMASDPGEMQRLLEELLRATPSDVLLRAWGQRMRTTLSPERLQRRFDELTPERKGLWHAQQLAERLMAEGVRALAAERYDEAATRFSHVLILDPLNVSAAMMLEITRDQARDWAMRVDRPLPLPWFAAADQALQRHRRAVEERRIEAEERSRQQLALRDLRTQWLEAYADHDLRQARQILHRMLDLDPGNASTIFFADLVERLLAAEEGRVGQ